MVFVEGDDLEVVLMAHRRAGAAAIEDARARLLEAVAREGKGAARGRTQFRVFVPPAEIGGAEENVLGGFAAFPVVTNDRLSGLLAVGGKGVARLPAEGAAFLGQVANQAHIVMENSRLFERVRDLSIRDGVTNLYNHRHIMELVRGEHDRAARHGDVFSVLMIDIDHFKKVNDDHGHPAGDAVLREVAQVIGDCLRAIDVVGRYGGEEFLALLPRTGHDEAVLTAERVRSRVAAHVFLPLERSIRVTVSIGVATAAAAAAASAAGLIHEADKALYRAKSAGRDRTA
jgi:diguanylate cyclase (GGDEF)-like protein